MWLWEMPSMGKGGGVVLVFSVVLDYFLTLLTIYVLADMAFLLLI